MQPDVQADSEYSRPGANEYTQHHLYDFTWHTPIRGTPEMVSGCTSVSLTPFEHNGL